MPNKRRMTESKMRAAQAQGRYNAEPINLNQGMGRFASLEELQPGRAAESEQERINVLDALSVHQGLPGGYENWDTDRLQALLQRINEEEYMRARYPGGTQGINLRGGGN